MNFDIAKVPFSRFGTNFAISHLRSGRDQPEGLYLRSVYMGSKPLFRLELGAGGYRVEYQVQATPGSLRLSPDVPGVGRKDSIFAEICIAAPDAVRMRGRGVGLRLVQEPAQHSCVVKAPDNRYRVLLGGQHKSYMLIPLTGGVHMDAPWGLHDAWGMKFHSCRHIHAAVLPDPQTGEFDFVVQEYTAQPGPLKLGVTFDKDVQTAQKEFDAWLDKMPSVPRKYAAAAELAAYVIWSGVVPAEGNFRDPAMLMSKNWMTSVWQWDNLFNAWASAYGNFDYAWRQFRLHLGHQHSSGALGDGITSGSVGFTYCKPPLHGWVLGQMMKRRRIDKAALRQVYEPIARATDWWMQNRDDDGDGVPQYHHGNDSGWDNATVFDVGLPVESPDLAADLVVQMHTLADVAKKIGKAKDAREWKRRGDELLARLLAHSWKNGRWIAPRSGDHAREDEGDCLLPYQAMILGKLLPKEVSKQMAADLAEPGRFLSPHGLASESLRSPKFLPSCYWRGSIWPPTTLIIVDGLAEAGHKALARDIAKRYCDMCVRSGFAENFHALTGAGQCDPAYTWAASVFLILAHEYI